MNTKLIWGFAASVLVGVTDGMPALADAGKLAATADLQEVVVTAEKRRDRVKDIPMSIYAVSGESLVANGVTNVQGLTQLAPSLQFAKSTNTFFMTIRGVGSETTDLGADPAIALGQDGIPLIRPQMLDTDFLDVQRVEVLRGPQGTIAGRNATAGALNIYTNQPTNTLEGGVAVTAGAYGLLKQDSFISGPLAGGWLLGRVAFATENANGWIKNTYIDPALGGSARAENLNNSDKAHGRISILLWPGDAFSALLSIDRLVDRSVPQAGMILGNGRGDGSPDELDVNNAKNGTSIAAPDVQALTTQSDIWQSEDVRQSITALKLAYEFSPTTSLTSHTGYVTRFSTQYVEYDGTAAVLTENAPIQYNSRVWSEELTLLTKPLEHMDLIVGGIALHDDSIEPLVFRSDNFGATSPGIVLPNLEQVTKSAALYAQIRYFITSALHVDLGGRYTKDEKSIDFGPEFFNGIGIAPRVTNSASWRASTPRLAVNYELGRAVALFASISRGYKAGGYNALSAPQKYNPEFVTTTEGGFKYQDASMNADLTLFYSDYRDIQQNIYLPNAAGTPSAEVRNASKAKVKGLEVQVAGRVSDPVTLFANATFLRARLTSATGVDPTFPELGVQSFDTHMLPRAPDIQAVFGAEVAYPIANNLVLVGNGSYRWQSRMYFDMYNDPTASQGAYGLLNLSAGIENAAGDWRGNVYVNNALDERYLSDKLNLVLVTSSTYGYVGAPRMWGITVSHRF